MTAEDQPNEHRAARRMRVARKGKVARNAASGSYDVLVRDISETGARLKFYGPTPLGPSFLLFVDGYSRLARSVWREGNEAGIEFIERREDP